VVLRFGAVGGWIELAKRVGAALARSSPPILVSVIESGSPGNIRGIESGQIDLGVGASPFPELAYLGRGEFSKPTTHVRLIAGIIGIPEPMFIVVARGGAIRSIGDLRGKRVWAGNPGWATTRLSKVLLGAAGVADQKRIENSTYKEACDKFLAGMLDALFVGTDLKSPNPRLEKLRDEVGIRILGYDTDIRAEAMKKLPGLIEVTIPKGFLGVLEEPVATVAFVHRIVVRDDLPEEVIYRVTKALWENIDALGRDLPEFSQSDPRKAAAKTLVPLHPGAARYYREMGALKD